MKTEFTDVQRTDPVIAEADRVFRKCVHCGFCLSTCPTYAVLGDERDSPRGRIYLMKNMLEEGGTPSPAALKHIDRCLSCLSCETTCPSGVDYRRLVDTARFRLEEAGVRPAFDRVLRAVLAHMLPYPKRFRAALALAPLAKPFAGVLDGRLAAMLRMAPKRSAKPAAIPPKTVYPAETKRKMRVALLTGCAQQVLRPAINDATIRLLTRLGAEVVVAPETVCCGALPYHLGREADGMAFARANVAPWIAEADGGELDAIVANASGCGTMIKDYAHVLARDPDWAEPAARIAALAKDVTEVIAELGDLPVQPGTRPALAYQDACSLLHGQKLKDPPRTLLTAAGFELRPIAEPHICCGSAGTYNLLQPDISAALRARKVAALEQSGAAAIATGNIGCLMQIAGATEMPIAHTVEYLDWATGGPKPEGV